MCFKLCMRLEKDCYFCFKSNRYDVRYADNLARHVNNLFPRASVTKVYCYNNYDNSRFSIYCSHTGKNLNKLRNITDSICKSKKSNFNKCSRFIAAMKKYFVGNCGESAFLAKIAAEINGIKNAKIASLYGYGERLDHSIVYVDGKKPYIIDCWLGFADYVQNAKERYVTEFRQFIVDEEKYPNFEPRYMYFVTKKSQNAFKSMRFSDKNIKELKEKYPEFILEKYNHENNTSTK